MASARDKSGPIRVCIVSIALSIAFGSVSASLARGSAQDQKASGTLPKVPNVPNVPGVLVPAVRECLRCRGACVRVVCMVLVVRTVLARSEATALSNCTISTQALGSPRITHCWQQHQGTVGTPRRSGTLRGAPLRACAPSAPIPFARPVRGRCFAQLPAR